MRLDVAGLTAEQTPVQHQPAQLDAVPLALLRSVRRHRGVVLVAVVAAVLSSLAVLTTTTRFVAASELVVTPMPRDSPALLGLPVIYDSGDPVRTIETAAAVVADPAAAEAASRELGEGWDVARVQEAVQVVPEGQTDLLLVRATADTPTVAVELANAYTDAVTRLRDARVEAFVDAAIARVARDLTAGAVEPDDVTAALEGQLAVLRSIADSGDPTVAVSQAAAVPVAAAGPPRSLVVCAALVAGLLIGVAAASVLDRRARSVHSRRPS